MSLAVSDGDLWMLSTSNGRRGSYENKAERSGNRRGVSSDFGFIAGGGYAGAGVGLGAAGIFLRVFRRWSRIFARDIVRGRWFAEGAKKSTGGTSRSEAVKNLATDEPGIRWCRNSDHDSMMWR